MNTEPDVTMDRDDDKSGPGRRARAPLWGGRLLLFSLSALVFLNLLWMVRNCQQLRRPSGGQSAPDFTVHKLGGGTFQLSQVRGHPVLVDFWATWCGPCKQSLPILDRVYTAYRDRGLSAIAVETDGAEGPAQRFVQSLSLQLPIGLGEPLVSELYGVDAIPHLVLINAEGRIQRVFHGVHGFEELSRAVEAAGLPEHK